MTTTIAASPSMTKTIGLRLDPLDVLFFRDGRPFGEGTHGQSGLASPQTLTGALRTRLLQAAGCDAAGFAKFGQLISRGSSLAEAAEQVCGAGWIEEVHVRGPWFYRTAAENEEASVLVPVPATLHIEKNPKIAGQLPRIVRLDPLRSTLPGWRPMRPGMRPLWLRKRLATEPLSGYLTLEGLADFLSGGAAELSKRDLPGRHLPAEAVFDFDRRTGIGVDPDRLTADDGNIYGARFLSLKPGMALYASVAAPPIALQALSEIDTLAFGGEGRRVRMEQITPPIWPTVKPKSGAGTMLVLTTPGLFDSRGGASGWLPACLEGRGDLVAAPFQTSGRCRRCGTVVWSTLPDFYRRCGAPEAEPERTLLGDWVAARLKRLGWRECGGCAARKAAINRWHERAIRLLLAFRRWV